MIIRIGLSVGFFATVCASAFARSTTATGELNIPPIIVKDSAGNPLPKSQAGLISQEKPYIAYGLRKADADGKIQFQQSDYHRPDGTELAHGSYEVMVLSAGKAPVISEWILPASEPLIITPTDGPEVEVILQTSSGKPLPEGIVPRFYPERFAMAAWPRLPEMPLESIWPQPLGDGRFKIELEETTTPWRVLIHDPKFLRGFEEPIETTAALAQGTLKVTLPDPADVEMKLDIPEKWKTSASNKDFAFAAFHMVNAGGEDRLHFEVARAENAKKKPGPSASFSNLAPGRYWLRTGEIDKDTGEPSEEELAFNNGVSLSIDGGELTTTLVKYHEFDPAKYKGSAQVALTVNKLDGSAAGKLPITIKAFDDVLRREITITSGTLSDKGTTTVAGLATDTYFTVYDARNRPMQLGYFNLDAMDKSSSKTLSLLPIAGDMAPDITLVDINTSRPVRLSDFRGQVVFLDFWATWCGPCQGPMEHNQQIMTKNAEHWKDKAVIVGASIDDKIKTVTDHVEKKGWGAVRHLWCDESMGENSKNSPQQIYGISSVPTALLIDAKGRIIWRGHPITIELEQEVEKQIRKVEN